MRWRCWRFFCRDQTSEGSLQIGWSLLTLTEIFSTVDMSQLISGNRNMRRHQTISDGQQLGPTIFVPTSAGIVDTFFSRRYKSSCRRIIQSYLIYSLLGRFSRNQNVVQQDTVSSPTFRFWERPLPFESHFICLSIISLSDSYPNCVL